MSGDETGQADPAHSYRAPKIRSNPSMKPKQRILLVEDSAEFALILTTWLAQRENLDVVHVSDLPEARRRMTMESWSALITDIELPSGNCFDFVSYAKQAHPQLAILVMTSHQRTDYVVEALRLKVDEFLFKPFDRTALFEKLVRLLESDQAVRPRRRVLAIGAHPDDIELGCGGTLRAHVLAGDQVHMLTLSGGEAGGEINVRQAESQRAAQIIGAKLTLATLRDTAISEGAETIAVIEAAVRETDPTVIYTHSEHDGHQDHRNVFRATVVAARRVPSLLCYQAPSATIDFRPVRFTEISGCLETKLQAIEAYSSQATQRPYMTPAMITATATYWGRFAGYGLCEPFEAVRELHSHD